MNGHRRTLLLVEDEDDIRDIVAMAAALRGYEVLVASDAREALERLEARGRVDVVVTDLMMPRFDGFELVQALREREAWRTIPAIVLTAAMLRDEERAALEPATILRKPLRLDTLFEVIDAALSAR